MGLAQITRRRWRRGAGHLACSGIGPDSVSTHLSNAGQALVPTTGGSIRVPEMSGSGRRLETRGPRPRSPSVTHSTRRAARASATGSSASRPYVVVQRARIVLMAHGGLGTEQIARELSCSSRHVRKWKARFAAAPCLASLEDAPRCGRPARITVATRCQLVQLACARSDSEDAPAPFRELWTYRALADSLAERTGERISVSEVGRILRYADLRPHRVRQWLKSEAPTSAAKQTAFVGCTYDRRRTP